MIISELFEAPQLCPECGGISFSNLILAEKKDACYYKVKASAKVWPSAYASGRLVQCRKKGAANYGNKSEGVAEGSQEDAKFTPRPQIRSRIETQLDQYLDPEKVAGAYTDVQYYKHDSRVYVEVLFNYNDGQKIGPTQRKRFLVNKDFTLTPIMKKGVAEEQELDEKWSQKYKSSINCSHPKGFSQKAHCAGKKKHNESVETEMVCEDCGMCQTPAVVEAQTDYQKRRQRERDVDAGKPVKPEPRNPQNDYFARRKKEKDLAEVSLGDYGKKAAVSRAGAEIKKFFGRDDPATVAAADQTIAKRERGLTRADARRRPYTAPKMDTEQQRQQLTDKYPNIDELVRRAEVNRDSNYEYADGQAYYDGKEAEQEYQRLLGIQRIIQGLSESKTLSDYMDEAKGIRNPFDLQPLEGPMGGGGGGSTRSGPSPFGPKPGSREASVAQNNPNTMTVKQGPNPDYRPQTTGDKPKVNVKPGETMDQAVQRTKTQQEFGKFLQGQGGQTFGAGGGRGGQGGPTAAQANTMSNAPVSVKNQPSAMSSVARDLTNPPKPTNKNTTTTNNSPRQNDRVDPLDMPRDPLDMIRPGYDGQLGSNPGPNTTDKKSSWLGKTAKGLGYAAGLYGAADVGSRVWDYYDQTKDMPSVKEAKKQPPEAKYDDDYDAMVARVKKLAGLGPLKTVYDPAKRQYRNMPTAQQPKK
jgi:hypothetical protein